MIKDKNQKGFALVLSLVLMLAMSLMGGALIVISASDHQSNNTADDYQQTFYVAETALLEGEKYLINKAMGPWDLKTHKRDTTKKVPTPVSQTSIFNGTMKKKNYQTSDKFYFNTKKYCFNSFPEISRTTIKVVTAESWNFGDVIRDSFDKGTNNDEKNEAERLKGYYYEYFIQNLGDAKFFGSGTSIKKKSSSSGLDGTAYRVHGCGIKAVEHQFNKDKKEHKVTGSMEKRIVVALESIVVLPK